MLTLWLLALPLGWLMPQSNAVDGNTKKAWAQMVGDWRVTGQPKRGSTAGAWVASSHVAWVVDAKPRELRLELKNSPRPASVRFPQDERGEVREMLVRQDEGERLFQLSPGSVADRATFVTDKTGPKGFERWTFQQKSLDRWMILVEFSKDGKSGWSRDVELGMTRVGTTISLGDGQPRCVVTGGLGETQVTIGGKSYYVCCSGCREALLEDPDAFIKPGKEPAGGAVNGKSVQP